MAELHEVLAVEKDLALRAKELVKSVIRTFGLETNFIGLVKTYQAYDDEAPGEQSETKLMATTVDAELNLVLASVGRWTEAIVTKDVTNTLAAAEILIDGEDVLGVGPLPATALLDLESKLALVLGIFQDIPTLDPKEIWEDDHNLPIGNYKAAPRITYRTQKELKTHVEAQATPSHPAQVKTYNIDRRVGEYTTTLTSGTWTLSQKRAAIGRIQTIYDAVKQARQRANRQPISDSKVWEPIQAFILGETS